MDAIPDEFAYDAQDDGVKSYYAAVEAKRRRGDEHWPERSTRSLQGVHIQDASSIDDFDCGAEPGAGDGHAPKRAGEGRVA